MSDFLNSSSLKRLGLDQLNIDTMKSYQFVDPTTNNHIIVIYLLNPNKLICKNCGCQTFYKIIKTKTIKINGCCDTENNIQIIGHRRCIKCLSCQKTFYEDNPFVERRSSISINTKFKIIELLKNEKLTYKDVGKILGVSTKTVTNTFDRDISIERLHLDKVICMDEVYAKRLSFHKYCFIIYSPNRQKIIDVVDSRRKYKLDEYFGKISWSERKTVEFISIDLYDTYKQIANKYFPYAKVCADPFHVIKNLFFFFNDLRNRIVKEGINSDSVSEYKIILYKRFGRLLNVKRCDLSESKKYIDCVCMSLSQKEIVKMMLSLSDELKEAYELVHQYREFNEKSKFADVEFHLDTICGKFSLCKIPEMRKFYSLLAKGKPEIINSFNIAYGRRVTNGPMERINRDVKLIFNLGFGMRNFERTRKRIMYVINNKKDK